MSINTKMIDRSIKQLENITGSKLTLGKLICAIRKGEDATQVNFAALLKMSRQQLCDIEHDRKAISPRLAAKYAKKLGYPPEQFIRLSLQDMVSREGLNVTIDVIPNIGNLIQKRGQQYAHAH
jgi:transcriptional regulator with XRE-family HTH domain